MVSYQEGGNCVCTKGIADMNKPYIVCCMVRFLDRRIRCAVVNKRCGDEYYDMLKTYTAQRYLNGRDTKETKFSGFAEL